jgi:hypothetical protein
MQATHIDLHTYVMLLIVIHMRYLKHTTKGGKNGEAMAIFTSVCSHDISEIAINS